MRFLVYTLLFLFIPYAGFTQAKQEYTSPTFLNTDTNTILQKNVNTPPPQVMTAFNDQCAGGMTGAAALSPSTPNFNGNTPALSFSAQSTLNDPFQILWSGTGKTTWVSYTPTTAGTLSVTITASVAGAQGLQVVIFSGGCPSSATTTAIQSVIGSATSGTLSTSTGPATAIATCLIPGQTYNIMLGEVSLATLYTVTTAYSPTTTGPSNNCCTNAQDVSANLNGSAITGGTTASATNDAPFIGGCNTAHNNVWYSFVAQGPNVEITVAGAANLGPEFELLAASSGTGTDVCTGTSVTSVTCNTASSATATANNLAGTPLITGQTYYVSVTSTLTAGGPFTLTVNNPTPNPPGTNCANATFLCSTSLPYTALGGNTNLWGYEDEDGTTGDCIGLNGEVHSAWYYVSVSSPGTLNLNIASAAASNYDFSVWKYTVGVAGNGICDNLSTTLVNCNSSPTASTSTGFNAAGVTTFTNSGSTINSQLTAAAGDVYAILVNSPAIAGTYTISTSGTAGLSCVNNVILPINLGDFTATQNENAIDLRWNTTSETNNSYFTIERGSDGTNFEELAKVKSMSANGYSKSPLSYENTDYSPLAGVSYYRLSQTDNNGKNNKLSIVSVINKDNDGAFIIAPNPTDGTLYITYNCQAATTGIFRLFDNNGAILLEQNVVCTLGNNKTQIDLQEKPNGIYFATFTTNTGFYRSKVIKK